MNDKLNWDALTSIFEKISELPESQRESRLGALELDERLRGRLKRMLRTVDQSFSLVDSALHAKINFDSSWHPEALLDKKIDDYCLDELLHTGAMSAVYRARPSAPVEREVVIKFLRPDCPEQFRTLFKFEQQALARQVHPSIVAIHDVVSSANGDTYRIL